MVQVVSMEEVPMRRLSASFQSNDVSGAQYSELRLFDRSHCRRTPSSSTRQSRRQSALVASRSSLLHSRSGMNISLVVGNLCWIRYLGSLMKCRRSSSRLTIWT